jgi:hypothetical protein
VAEHVTAGCIDSDPPTLGRTFGQLDGSLMQTVHMHHAMRVMSAETRCQISSLKGEAMNWLSDPKYGALRLRLENAHAAIESAAVEARRRVKLNEGDARRK